jgi:hypothetical protein
MRVCVIHQAQDLRLEEHPAPAVESHGVLIRVRAGGICGSDLHYYFEGRNGDFLIREPFIPGHEFSGEVADVGSEVTRVRAGQRVAIHPGRNCGRCFACREGRGNLCRNVFFMGSASRFPHMPGGFADYVLVDESQCYPVSPDLPFTTAAFAEPLAVALHAVERARPALGRSVLITGAGPIGLLVLLAARRAGAEPSASPTSSIHPWRWPDASARTPRSMSARTGMRSRSSGPPDSRSRLKYPVTPQDSQPASKQCVRARPWCRWAHSHLANSRSSATSSWPRSSISAARCALTGNSHIRSPVWTAG